MPIILSYTDGKFKTGSADYGFIGELWMELI